MTRVGASVSSALISDPCWRAEGLAAIEEHNEDLLDVVDELRQQPYFRYVSVNLLNGCNYFPQQEDECDSRSCELYPVDDEGIVPEAIIETDGEEYDFELDGWVRWDMPSEDYYDLFENREAFTGYDGRKIWTFVHEKICFDESGFSSALGSTEGEVWQRDFNRVVSGLHSSINCHIVEGIANAPNSRPPKMNDRNDLLDADAEFERRLVNFPQAIEHLYFA